MVEEVQPRADLQRRRFRSLRRVGWRGERNATRRLQLESGSSQQEDESDHGAMTPERSPPVTTLRKTPGRLSVSRAPGRASRAPAKLAEQLRRGDANGSHLRFADHRITSFRRRGQDNGRIPRRARKAMDGGSGRGLLAPAEDTQRPQRVPPAGPTVAVLERKVDLAAMRVLQQPGAIGLLLGSEQIDRFVHP